MILVIEIVSLQYSFCYPFNMENKDKTRMENSGYAKKFCKKVVRKREYRRKNFKIFTEKEKTLKRSPFYILSVVLLTVMMWFCRSKKLCKRIHIFVFVMCDSKIGMCACN